MGRWFRSFSQNVQVDIKKLIESNGRVEAERDAEGNWSLSLVLFLREFRHIAAVIPRIVISHPLDCEQMVSKCRIQRMNDQYGVCFPGGLVDVDIIFDQIVPKA